MDNNYLWDRSGEPDAEIRELEELLSTLKYQPRPLQIPSTLRTGRKRSFIPLTIAAAIALVMVGAGLWIRFAGSPARQHDRPAVQARDDRSAPNANQTPAPLPQDQVVAISTPPRRIMSSGSKRTTNPRLARNNTRHIRTAPAPLTKQELAERDQILIALRLASAKLNLAQRRTQTLSQANTFRN